MADEPEGKFIQVCVGGGECVCVGVWVGVCVCMWRCGGVSVREHACVCARTSV